MNFNEYQKLAHITAIYPDELGVLYPLIGMASEAGEIMEKVKKALRSGELTLENLRNPPPALVAMLVPEIGDVLWYASESAYRLNHPLNLIAQMNIEKLKSRSIRGMLIGEGDNR